MVFATVEQLMSSPKQMSTPMAVLLAACFCAVMPLELSQLIFAFIGALAYWMFQTLQPRVNTTQKAVNDKPKYVHTVKGNDLSSIVGSDLPHSRPKGAEDKPWKTVAPGSRLPYRSREAARELARENKKTWKQDSPEKKEVRKPSMMPIVPPCFKSTDWEGEVQELLEQIAPTAESDRIVEQLASAVKQTIRRSIPEAEVAGFASGDLTRGKAFGVAVPDVDIVINVSPTVLVNRLQCRLSQGKTNVPHLDARKLQKSAIRVCTDLLVSSGGFKFRRSAFRGEEPKVTLLAPASLGIVSEAVPIDFTVNSETPLYHAALLTECGQIDPRAKALILLVKRWAKDRGICHAAKGHLAPYLWSLLTMYFLQVGVSEEGPILPPVESFRSSSILMSQQRDANASSKATPKKAAANGSSPKPVGALFKDFINFYASQFDWRNEAICVRHGKRGPPGLGLPIHIIVHDDGTTTEVGPSVEDPFRSGRNLGEGVTAGGMARLREELQRAADICNHAEASLSKLLEPWMPPEAADENAPAASADADEDMAQKSGSGSGSDTNNTKAPDLSTRQSLDDCGQDGS